MHMLERDDDMKHEIHDHEALYFHLSTTIYEYDTARHRAAPQRMSPFMSSCWRVWWNEKVKHNFISALFRNKELLLFTNMVYKMLQSLWILGKFGFKLN